MKIPGIDAYNNPYVNRANGFGPSDGVQQSARTGAASHPAQTEVKLNDPQKIVTNKERDFFIKMFPDNSEQLSKHVLFNRNGRLQSHNLSKGSIIDGRI